MNVFNFTGGLGRDSEVRHTPKGDAINSFSVAVNSGYGDKAITSWVNCNLWGKQAESLAPYLKKGTKVAISGELTNRPYTTKDGAEKFSLEVRVNSLTLIGGKPDGSENSNVHDTRTDAKTEQEFEDSIPF